MLAVKPLSNNGISLYGNLFSLRNSDVFVTYSGAFSGEPSRFRKRPHAWLPTSSRWAQMSC